MNKDNKRKNFEKHSVRTAILVDGGFYRKRAKVLWGNKTPAERADELNNYCYRHLHDNYENRYLYRFFITIAHLLQKMFITWLPKKLFPLNAQQNIHG